MKWIVLLVISGCAPASQLLLHIDTDATLPGAAGRPWLFDRLRIDVFQGDQLAASNDFAVDEPLFASGRASFGIAPAVGDDTVRARVRLFRGDRLAGGQPPARTTLDTTLALPALDPSSSGTVDVYLTLHVDDVGVSLGQPTPLAPSTDAFPSSMVGTWPGATEVPCKEAAGDGEACVPGGAFFMGDPAMTLEGMGQDPNEERLVVVSPFFIDLHEATVGEYRKRAPSFFQVQKIPVRDLTGDPSDLRSWCYWTAAPDAFEAMAINCVARVTAVAYCHSFHKDLPTEAQFEFLASGRGAEQGYVWGGDDPICSDATFSRSSFAYWQKFGFAGACRPLGTIGGPGVPGSGLRDRVTLIDPVSGERREVVDLAGNLGEFARDRWSRPGEPFWSRPGIFRDPVADQPSDDDSTVETTRGGDWTSFPYALRAAFRAGQPVNAVSPGFGIRCVRAATQ